MSHVARVDCEIRDLDALEIAVAKMGAELRRNQKTFRMWGTGSSAHQPCVHAITLTGDKNAYEVGLRQKTAGDPNTFEFACDFFDGKLTRAFGPNLTTLQNEYLAVVAERQLARRGWRVRREVDTRQQVRLVAQL